MGLFTKIVGGAIKFAAQELTSSTLSEVGQHVGDAVGTLLGRKIDPDHHRDKDEKKAKSEKPEIVEEDEDEVEDG